ncbi:MAG: hypothetical protein GWO41_16645 [candidate division Zixibacteria bacterium]|nr:hypothetical protein [candidate division Zixibacteria bacterium]NIR63550.1 hypothetical protein [candidate division Zixibacteria bacterium]NIS18041.1 hypothetical protein [candidate division Zixibacteria bacterium]NIS45496.1 hypothetical protein [candidate division Zixibacteria bacterium]NIT54321.1 hypothetical protein [candidate division Zixibacteria bacterium]
MRILTWVIHNPLRFASLALMFGGAVAVVVGAVTLASSASVAVGSAWLFGGLLIYLSGSTVNRYLRGDFYYQRL